MFERSVIELRFVLMNKRTNSNERHLVDKFGVLFGKDRTQVINSITEQLLRVEMRSYQLT